MKLRFGTRSAMTPANSTKIVIGRNCSIVTVPSATFESVICSTSHACAMVCIHVPLSEIVWPK